MRERIRKFFFSEKTQSPERQTDARLDALTQTIGDLPPRTKGTEYGLKDLKFLIQDASRNAIEYAGREDDISKLENFMQAGKLPEAVGQIRTIAFKQDFYIIQQETKKLDTNDELRAKAELLDLTTLLSKQWKHGPQFNLNDFRRSLQSGWKDDPKYSRKAVDGVLSLQDWLQRRNRQLEQGDLAIVPNDDSQGGVSVVTDEKGALSGVDSDIKKARE